MLGRWCAANGLDQLLTACRFDQTRTDAGNAASDGFVAVAGQENHSQSESLAQQLRAFYSVPRSSQPYVNKGDVRFGLLAKTDRIVHGGGNAGHLAPGQAQKI